MSSSCQFGESDAALSSGWVEDFLIEFYLEGSSGVHGTGGATELQNGHDARFSVDGDLSAEAYGSCAVDVESPTELRTAKDLYEPQQQQIDGNTECLEEASAEDEKMLEAWQAQYGQVVRSGMEAEVCPRAISLWNWTTVVAKGKHRSKPSTRLFGQLAQTSSRLHHSLQHHNGFFKTTHVCEVNLDLVKVSSGEIFRLRQPSLKYLSSVALFDSSNPTKGWNFPCITFSSLDETAGHLGTVACAASKLSPNSSVMKPFIPNWNHQRYQQFNEIKVASLPAIPAGLRALSGGERASVEQRKRKYRDRAKERREHYADEEEESENGMDHLKQERVSLAEDTDNATEEKSKRNLTRRHMLERMGWCEGESLGKRKDGLIRPLDAAGNHGRAGIGWFSLHNHSKKSLHGILEQGTTDMLTLLSSSHKEYA